MSLQVWLPLNRDLHNQGLTNINVTNNGATIDDNGKIGQCYSFDGENDYLVLNNFNCSSWVEFSLSCWCYPTADFIALFLIRGGTAHRVSVSSGGFIFRDSNNSSLRTIGFGAEIPQNEWSHLTCVYNRGEIFMYVNGELTNHNTTYGQSNSTFLADLSEFRIGRTQSSSADNYYSGRINDFRIYDHALSKKEVEELAKGLVLHYKLDNEKVCDSSGYGNNGTIVGTMTIDNDTPRNSNSIYFNGENQITNIPVINPTGNLENEFSFFTWINRQGSIPTASATIYTGIVYVYIYKNDETIRISWHAANADLSYNQGNTWAPPALNAPQNEWVHIGFTFKDGDFKCYKNGIQVGTNGRNPFIRGSYDDNYIGSSTLNAKLSDLRIYKTCLSDEQVLELYNTSATIDNKGNTYGKEIVEDEIVSITKQGQIKSNKIVEQVDTQTSIEKTTNNINSYSFYEY